MVEKSLKISVVALAFAYSVNFIFLGFLIGPFDYDHLSAYYEIAWRFWTHSPGIPQYNPFLCGGRTLGGDPQIPIFNPIVLLIPILGSTWTIKLELLTQLILGSLGLDRWLKDWGCELSGRLWGIFLFIAGGGVVAKFLVGHVTLGFYLLLPIFFWLSYQLSNSRKFFSKKTVLLYWILFIYSGLYKPNFLIYLVPMLLIETLTRSLLSKNFWGLGHFIVAVIVSGLCNATSELPAFFYFKEFPLRQDTVGAYYTPVYTFLFNLLLPLKTIPKILYGPGYFLQRHEYNIFIGPLGLYFAFQGLKSLKVKRPEIVSLFVFFVVSAWTGFGSFEDKFSFWYPFTWLKTGWPGFTSIRVPTRFWFGSYLSLIVFSAIGFSKTHKKLPTWALLTVGIFPLLITSIVNLSKTTVQATQTQWTISSNYPSQIIQTFGTSSDIYKPIREGKGVINCLRNLAVNESAKLTENDSLHNESTPQVPVKLNWLSWNQVQLSAQSSTPTPVKISINLNSSPYWKFMGNGQIDYKPGGLLTVRGTSGILSGVLVFEQPWVKESIILSLGGYFIVLLFIFFWPKRTVK
jgi:hypothetical protein